MLSEEIVLCRDKVVSLQHALSASKKEVELLKHQLQESESTFSEELLKKDACIHHYETVLEQNSQTIAQLTNKYHQMKAKLIQTIEANSLKQGLPLPFLTYTREGLETPESGQRARRAHSYITSSSSNFLLKDLVKLLKSLNPFL